MNALGPQQYPVDYILTFGLARFTSDIHILRLLPLGWGVASVVAIYFLGRSVGDETFALLWATSLSFSVFHIDYSVTLRPYSLIVFLSILSTLAFNQIKFKGRRGWLWPYAITTFLFLMAYPFGLAKAAVEFIWALRSRPSRDRNLSLVIAFVSSFPLLFALHKLTFVIGNNPFSFDLNYSFSFPVVVNLINRFGQDSAPIAALFFLLFIFGLVLALKDRRTEAGMPLNYLWVVLITTVGSTFLGVAGARLFAEPRHFIAILPLYLGFSMIPLARLSQKAATSGRLKLLLLLLVTASSGPSLVALWQLSERVERELKGATDFLKSNVREGDAVLFGDPNQGATFLYYLDSSAFRRLDGVPLSGGLNLFRFPSALTFSNGKISTPVYTMCAYDPSLETMNASSPAHFWFLFLPFRYVPNNALKDLAAVPALKIEEKYRGVFLCQK